MNISRSEIVKIVEGIATEFNATLERKIQLDQGEGAPLYGRDGCLDSLNLVSFVIAVEQTLDEKLDLVINLADEKAMSQIHSPYRTIGALVEYIISLLPPDFQVND